MDDIMSSEVNLGGAAVRAARGAGVESAAVMPLRGSADGTLTDLSNGR